MKVTIDAALPPEGEYDDDAYGLAVDVLTDAVADAVDAGARLENLEQAIETGLENAGAS